MDDTTFPTSLRLRVGKHKKLSATAKLCRNACHLLIAALDPTDRVQPRSRTTCVGWLARFKGTDAIHAVCLVQDHPVAEVEESSDKLEYQSSDSQE